MQSNTKFYSSMQIALSIANALFIGAAISMFLNVIEEKKKLSELRNSSIVKQEKLIETKARELQEELKKLLQKSPSESK